jgi:hypothetical protein
MDSHLRKLVWAMALVCLFGWALGYSGQAEIEGHYKFIEDQPSKMSAAQGAEILLSVAPGGIMSVTASKPGEVMTSQGTYQIQGDRISLDFPELDKSVKGGPWKLEKDILTLPLQFIGDGPGTSKWQRLQTGSGPIQRFFEVFNREIESGVKADQAILRAAEEAKRVSLRRSPSDKALRISGFQPWMDGTGCDLEFEDGHEEGVMTIIGSLENPAEKKQVIGPMARDPRTHIPAQPHTSPDDPKSRTAILFSPYNDTPFYGGFPGMLTPATLVRVPSHKEMGDDMDILKDKLESRNYKVIVLKDAEATPLALHKAILENKPAPGVIYFSTHGGTTKNGKYVVLGTGVNLGIGLNEDDVHKTNPRIKEILDRTVPAGYFGWETETRYKLAAYPVMAVWKQKDKYLPVAYLFIRNLFFDKIREEGADFSSSFVYANGCATAYNATLAESLQAKMFLGNRLGGYFRSIAPQSRWIFTRLAKRTFSVREVLGLMRHIVKTGVEIFPEDGWLARVDEENDANLVLYGADRKEAEIPDFDVLYLCWLARWSVKDTEAGAEALEKTYVEFWQKKSFSRLKSPFANAGVRGTHVPEEDEVKFARHLVSGVPTMPCGRFTLNDKDPGKNKSGKSS